MPIVRESKFRNIFGTPWKREFCYNNIRISQSSWDSPMCAVNPAFLAVIVEVGGGGGAFMVIPINMTGRIPSAFPLVGGHKKPVLDIAWCPHNDNLIASGSEDSFVRVWEIPDQPLSSALTKPMVELRHHHRRVGQIMWHPSALNVLLSVGADKDIVIWNVGNGEILNVIDCHPDFLYGACWNWDGSQIVTTCRDRKLRIINPRNGNIIEEGMCHEGAKASRAIFLKSGLIFTTGFGNFSQREYSLRAPEYLNDPIVLAELDNNNGMIFPMYDPDHNLIYLCGKGDSSFHFFEVTNQAPFVHYISKYQTPDAQRGIAMMPKRALNTSQCEIARFFRFNKDGFCQVVSITVPRRSEGFHADLYPDTIGSEATITAEEWFAGNLMSGGNAEPCLISLSDAHAQLRALNEKKEEKIQKELQRREMLEESSTSCSAARRVDDKLSKASLQKHNEMEEMKGDIHNLKLIINSHDKSIRKLKVQFKQFKRISDAHSGSEVFLPYLIGPGSQEAILRVVNTGFLSKIGQDAKLLPDGTNPYYHDESLKIMRKLGQMID